MARPFHPPAARRAAASVLEIRNPLTRVGYSLAEGSGHLLLLLSGQAALRAPTGARGPVQEGPRLLWRRVAGGGELLAEGGARGLLLSVPALALARALPATPLGDEMRATLGQDLSLPVAQPAQLADLIRQHLAERTEAAPGADEAAGHLLALILLRLWRIGRADLVGRGHAPRDLAERFVVLAGQHVREHWRVADYARALEVGRDRLGAAVRRATGLSPQDYLHRELVRQAVSLLVDTGLPAEQVGFRLGFTDPAYFTRFFQRQTGQTPGRFRRSTTEGRREGDQSFAAWP